MSDISVVSLFNVTEIDIAYRNKCRPEDRKRISTSKAAYDILFNSRDMMKIEAVEQFKAIF